VLRGERATAGRGGSGCRKRRRCNGSSRLLQHAIPQLLLARHPGLRAAVLLDDGSSGRFSRLHPSLLLGNPLLQSSSIFKEVAWSAIRPLSALPHPRPAHAEQPGGELQVHGQQRGLPAGPEHHLERGHTSARRGSKVSRLRHRGQRPHLPDVSKSRGGSIVLGDGDVDEERVGHEILATTDLPVDEEGAPRSKCSESKRGDEKTADVVHTLPDARARKGVPL